MRQYKARKPCRLLGKDYLIGDIIPDEAVLPAARDELVTIGLIEPIEKGAKADATIPVTIIGKGGEKVISVPAEDVSRILLILQTPTNEAVSLLDGIGAEAKTVLAAVDKRKAIKAALETVVIDNADTDSEA